MILSSAAILCILINYLLQGPHTMRNMKESTHEEPLIHPSIWIRNDEAEGSIRSLPMKQIKISIQFSFHDFVLLCIFLYSVDVLCMIECLH